MTQRAYNAPPMCGINAHFRYRSDAPPIDLEEVVRTREAMQSRGPDASGLWQSPDGRVAFGHRRLSIIDTSHRADQPMLTREGDVTIVFNGEIYNYRELRDDLEARGDRFDTTSDTEVLLRLYRSEGAEMIPRLRGMFAFCIWDARRGSMLLTRDAYGIKPLYYADDGRAVRIASQVRALLAGGVPPTRDNAGVAGFLLRGHVPEPFTMYDTIRAVPAGSWMTIGEHGFSDVRRYFSIAEVWREAVQERRQMTREERIEIIRDAVADSVRYHLVSDVPVGAFLSSGRDSSTVVALAAESGTPLRTVTLRFEEYAGTPKDEAPLAEAVAREYGTDHTTYTLSAMDQPSIDGLNSYFVCRAAAQLGWKVALSGTGGDELFGGYTTFRSMPRLIRLVSIFRYLPSAADAFRRAYTRAMPKNPNWSPKTAAGPKYAWSYEGAYLIKRGLFLPYELPSVMGEAAAEDGLSRLRILDRIRQTITPDPGTPFARIATLHARSASARSRLGQHGPFPGDARAAGRSGPPAEDRAGGRGDERARRQGAAVDVTGKAAAGGDHHPAEDRIHAPDPAVARGAAHVGRASVRDARVGFVPCARVILSRGDGEGSPAQLPRDSSLSSQLGMTPPPLRAFVLLLLHRCDRALESDLRVRAVAERLRRRAAAAAERAFQQWDLVAVHVDDFDVAVDEVRTVFLDFDRDAHPRAPKRPDSRSRDGSAICR